MSGRPASAGRPFRPECVVTLMIQIEQIGEVRKFRLARTMAGRGLYFTAAYWVDGLMVDTGCAYTVRELLESVDNLPVRCIVNTHSHEDHIAGNAALQAKFGAEILAHPEALPILAQPRKRRLRPYQLVMWGYPEPSDAKAIGDVVETEHHRFEVIYTPGHSPDHICLYEPKHGWLFTGDVYVGGRDRALRADYNVWQIIDSLKDLASLDVKILFPGSGTARESPHEELLDKIKYPGRDRPTSADSAPAGLEQTANTPPPIRWGNVDSLLYSGPLQRQEPGPFVHRRPARIVIAKNNVRI